MIHSVIFFSSVVGPQNYGKYVSGKGAGMGGGDGGQGWGAGMGGVMGGGGGIFSINKDILQEI